MFETGAGSDTMSGGTGADTFLFSRGSTATSEAKSHIDLFVSGEDKIQLDLAVVLYAEDAIVRANYDSAFASANKYFSSNSTATAYLVEVTGGGSYLFVDAWGDDQADDAIHLMGIGLSGLAIGDFT